MPTFYPLLLLSLLAPLALQAEPASEIENTRLRQQQLQAETQQLRQRNAEQQQRLKQLQQAIALQRERNRELDSALEKTVPKTTFSAPDRRPQGK